MSFFETVYQGTPAWDIGRPQQAFVRLLRQGAIRGSILDVGCGTGENALLMASAGHEVWGVDLVPAAVDRAKVKARTRELEVHFQVADALSLEKLGRTFDTVIDSGLFHVFDDTNRRIYARSLAAAAKPGATLYLLCFSDLQAPDRGPRRVSKAEIRAAFADGWTVESIQPELFASHLHRPGARAWLSTIRRSPLRQ
jgi:SAM-dependent methyltransferase